MKAFISLLLLASAVAFAQTSRVDTLVSPEVLPDRRVTFRVRAPKASEVSLFGDWMISVVQEPATFRRFLALVASRHGQVLNKSDLAAPLGMSVPGIGRWLDVLKATAQVLIVPPYFENVG